MQVEKRAYLTFIFTLIIGLNLSSSYPAQGKEIFRLLVLNGTGSGRYRVGDNIEIRADDPFPGKIFEKWEGGNGYIVDVYSPSTMITIPSANILIHPVYRDNSSCGIDDIDRIREKVKTKETTIENAPSRRATLYRWWRLLWRQGYDMSSFNETANMLISYSDKTEQGWQAITQGFQVLESLQVNPVFIPEIKKKPNEKSTNSKTNWPFYHGVDGSQIGYSPDVGPSEGKLTWRFPKPNRWNAKPIIRDGRVYLSSPGVDVVGYCLSEKTGKVIWKARQYGTDLYGTPGSRRDPLVSTDRVIFITGKVRPSLFIFDKSTGVRIHSSQATDLFSDKKELAVSKHGRNSVVLADVRTGAQIWQFTTEGFLAGDPLLVGDKIYIVSQDGQVYCLKTISNEPIWKHDLGTGLRGSPGAGGEKILVGSTDRRLFALDANDGGVVWTFQASERENRAYQFFSSAVKANNRIYVGAANKYLYCLDADKGNLIWKYKVSDWIRSKPIVIGDLVFVATLDGNLLTLQDNDLSANELRKIHLTEQGFTADLVGNENGILASGRDLVLYSVSVETGYLQWRHGISDGTWIDGQFFRAGWIGGLQPSPTIVDGMVYCGGPDGFVHAINAESGEEVWRFEARGSTSASPTVADGKVFFGEIDGFDNYYALNKDTGELVWKTQEYGKVWVSAAFVKNRLIIGDMDRYVYAVNPDNGQRLWRYDTAKDTPKEHIPKDSKRGHGYPPGIYCNPAADATRVFTGSWSGYYFAFDPLTGKMLWRTQTNNGNPDGGLPDSAAPVLWKNHLYVQKLGVFLAALNKNTGEIDWEWRAPAGFLQNGTIAANKNRIFGSIVCKVTELPYNATVLAFHDVENGGALLWEYKGGGGLTAPVITDDKIIFGSSGDVFLTCLNPEDGSIKWRFYTGGEMLENVPAIYGNKVFVHCKNDWLFAVQ